MFYPLVQFGTASSQGRVLFTPEACLPSAPLAHLNLLFPRGFLSPERPVGESTNSDLDLILILILNGTALAEGVWLVSRGGQDL